MAAEIISLPVTISSLAERNSQGKLSACNGPRKVPVPVDYVFRILLGETQEDLATAMKEWFSLGRHTVQLENNGLRILQCLRLDHYDLIVLEMALFGLDGISVVRRYRATGGNTPIVLLASRHCSQKLQSGVDGGADAYVAKPFRLGDCFWQTKSDRERSDCWERFRLDGKHTGIVKTVPSKH